MRMLINAHLMLCHFTSGAMVDKEVGLERMLFSLHPLLVGYETATQLVRDDLHI